MNVAINRGFAELQEDKIQGLIEELPWMKEKDMRLCRSVEELSEFIDKALEEGICALDTETTGLNSRVYDGESVDKLVGFCLSYNPSLGIYVPIRHQEDKDSNLPEKRVIAEIRRLCMNCKKLVFHHFKFDMTFLKNYGIPLIEHDRFEDTLLLAKIFDAGQKENGLKHLSEQHLGKKMLSFKSVTKGAENRFDLISPHNGYVYAVSDAICTLELYHFFINQEIVQEQRQVYNLEKRVVYAVMEMESNLIRIDREYLEDLGKKISAQMEEIEKKIYKAAGQKFDMNSPLQMGKILFEHLEYKYPERAMTKSGQYFTNEKTLSKIKDTYPLVQDIIKYRGLDKSLGTYVRNLLKNTDRDGFVKMHFNQSGTDTGRFSSPGGSGLDVDGYSGVNAQGIPATYSEGTPDIRKGFIARPGNKIVAMDYSGEELRVAANLSGEPNWVDEFLHGSGDLHTKTGQILFGRQNISKEERQTAKCVNFQVLYGAGPKGVSEQAGVSVVEARRLLEAFFAGLPTLKRWIDVGRARSRRHKKAQTVFKRIRPLQGYYDSGEPGLISHADRCATNFFIQGCCADIMKTALVRVYNWIHKNDLQDQIRMLITVHDEIVYEMPADKLEEYIPQLYRIMTLRDILQGGLKWPVPLELDAEYGDTWHADHDFFKERPDLLNVGEDLQFHHSQKQEVSVSAETEKMIEETPKEQPVIPEESLEVPESEPETSEVSESHEVPQEPKKEPEIDEKGAEEEKGGIEGLDYLIYTIRNRRKTTLRRLNDILGFLDEEREKKFIDFKNLKILKLKDKDGSSFLIDDVIVPEEGFLILVRYFGI